MSDLDDLFGAEKVRCSNCGSTDITIEMQRDFMRIPSSTDYQKIMPQNTGSALISCENCTRYFHFDLEFVNKKNDEVGNENS